MRLVLVGCEYVGKTTLAHGVAAWIERTMGPPIPPGMPPFHDHFTFPDIAHGGLTDEECEQVMALSPRLKSMIQNHQILYHLNPSFYGDHDNIMVGFHIENAVYGPLYHGYGEDGSGSAIARNVEGHIMGVAGDTVLVLMRASAQVISRRMGESPHPRGVLKEKDIDHVLKRFEEEYAASIIRYRFVLDTTATTPAETLAQFVEYIQPHLAESDRTRLLAHRALRSDG
jgi:hypothetical protein